MSSKIQIFAYLLKSQAEISKHKNDKSYCISWLNINKNYFKPSFLYLVDGLAWPYRDFIGNKLPQGLMNITIIQTHEIALFIVYGRITLFRFVFKADQNFLIISLKG